MPNPFESLGKQVEEEDLSYDEWGGQFSCQSSGCNGYALIAKYFKKSKMLAWECQEGHVSRINDIDE
jgi:hypothetical protein